MIGLISINHKQKVIAFFFFMVRTEFLDSLKNHSEILQGNWTVLNKLPKSRKIKEVLGTLQIRSDREKP